MITLFFSCNPKLADQVQDSRLFPSEEFPPKYYELLSKVEKLNPEYDMLVQEGKTIEADALKKEIEKIEQMMIEMGGGPIKGIVIDNEVSLEKKMKIK